MKDVGCAYTLNGLSRTPLVADMLTKRYGDSSIERHHHHRLLTAVVVVDIVRRCSKPNGPVTIH